MALVAFGLRRFHRLVWPTAPPWAPATATATRHAAAAAAKPARPGACENETEQLCAKMIKDTIQNLKLNVVLASLSSSEVHSLGVAAMSRHFKKDIQQELMKADGDDSGDISKHE